MPQSTSHNHLSDTSAPDSNAINIEPLRLTKQRPKTPGQAEDLGLPPVHNLDRNNNRSGSGQTANSRRFQQSRTPSPFFDPNDPAFSSDPNHHPDHDGQLAVGGGRCMNGGEGGPSLVRHDSDTDHDPPPAYDEAVPASPHGQMKHTLPRDESTSSQIDDSEGVQGTSSSHIRERAQVSYSPVLTPSSSNPDLLRSQRLDEEDLAEQEELLAYLSDSENGLYGEPQRDVPMSLRPHRGAPISDQTLPPTGSPAHIRSGPNTGGLLRSATMPSSATRTVGEPSTRTGTEIPRFPPRGDSTPRRAPENLDRIDELDESVLLGVPLHHSGPYEMQGKVYTPPPRGAPLDRQQQPLPKQHVLIATTPLNAPPPPVPFKLNLKPGEILTRVPPPRSQTTPPERNPPMVMGYNPSIAAEQPMYGSSRSAAPNQVNPRLVPQNNRQNDWSPEKLYEDHAHAPPPRSLSNAVRPSYQANIPNGPLLSYANTSRSDIRAMLRPGPDTRFQEERFASQNSTSFQQPTQPQQSPQQSMLSRSISQPVQPSSASVYSSSPSTSSRAPTSADRFLPKRIVLPTPLHRNNQNRNGNPTYTLPSELMRNAGQNSTTTLLNRPAAAVIPVHDSKKGNFLKKRASTSHSTHENHKHLLPERSASTKGFFGLGGSFGKSLTPSPEPVLSKASRKLSKRVK